MKFLQWMKRKKKYFFIIILVSTLFGCVDYSLVKQKKDPFFAFFPIYNVYDIFEKEYYRIHIGPFYYIKIESEDDSDIEVKSSSHTGIGIWFLPSITIYKNIYER